MKHKRIGFLLLVGLVFLLTGCFGEPLTTFAGTESVTVRAKNSWVQLSTDEEKRSMFDAAGGNIDGVALALEEKGKKGGYFVITKESQPMRMADLNGILESLISEAKTYGTKATLEDYQDAFTPREQQLLTPILNGETPTDADKVYLLQEMYLQEYLKSWAKDPAVRYELKGIEDWTINGQKAQVATYKTLNTDGYAICTMETNIYKNDQIYTIQAWSAEKDFDQHRKQFATMLQSVEIAQ